MKINNGKTWKLIFIFTCCIECVTCFFRFFLSLQSTRDTSFLSDVTFGIRIHHGYIGLLLVLTVLFISKSKRNKVHYVFYVLGMSLFFSDIVHHFLVLWLATGNPEFDLFYK